MEHTGERAFEHLGEKVIERTIAKNPGGKRFIGTRLRPPPRLMRRGGHEIIVEHAGKKLMGEQALDRCARKTSQRILKHSGEHAVVERTGEKSSERLLEHVISSNSSSSARIITARVGRRLMIALPRLWAFSTFYLFKSDLDRWNEEHRYLLSSQKGCPHSKIFPASVACWFFVGARVADFIDGRVHFSLAYGFFKQLAHRTMAVLERTSVRCAVISTILAVLGEIFSQRSRRQKQKQQSQPQN